MEDGFRLPIQGVSKGEVCAAVEDERLKGSGECFHNHMRLEESIWELLNVGLLLYSLRGWLPNDLMFDTQKTSCRIVDGLKDR